MSTTCLAVALCLVLLSASAEEDIVLQTCWKQCVDYKRWGYDCAMRAGCFEKLQIDEDAFSACFQPCNVGAFACEKLCHQNYEDLKDTCVQECEDASIMDVNCEDDCFEEEFETRYSAQLPDLTSQDVGVWQGIPGLDEDIDLFDNDDDDDEEEEGDDQPEEDDK